MSVLFRFLLAGLAALVLATAAAAAEPQRVFRYAFPIAETGFDPAQISDIYSRTVTPHIFEALYAYDPLALPVKIVPLTAAALPEHSPDFRVWTVRLKPGIHFAEDEAFKGKQRELVAEDYVYSFKRFADPAVKSPMWAYLEEQGIEGLGAVRQAALKDKKPFDYDRPVEGLRALDRYTLQFRLRAPRPRFLYALANSDLFGAVAREVVQARGGDITGHPVGTGPFVLKQWRRSSLIVLERNPGYRERVYEAEPRPDDAEGQAILARLKGRRLPMVDRVEVSIIEESQPRWLSFVGGEHELIDRVPPEFVTVALPGGKLAPNLARQGLQLYRSLAADSAFTFFNMEDPTLGGYTPERVALRRALSLALDIEREIRMVRRGQAIVAQSLLLPHTSGYDAGFKSENGDHDPARANALLDLYGFVDRDGDGWRDMPDGQPLVIEVATQPDALSRQYDELWKSNLDRVHIRSKFFPGKWPEQLKQARAGKLQLWMLGTTATSPDGADALQRLYGPQAGNQNMSRFKLPEFDALYERLQVLPDGPEREALFLQAKRLQAAWMPMKTHVHRIVNDMAQPWVIGYRRPLFRNEFWHLIDVEPGRHGSR